MKTIFASSIYVRKRACLKGKGAFYYNAAKWIFQLPGCSFVSMKIICQIFAAVALIIQMTGCASTKAYLVDRGRDAADIFSFSVGPSIGAGARIGPVHCGLLGHVGVAGLQGGEFICAGESSGMRIIGLWTDTLIPIPLHGDIESGQTIMQTRQERNKSYYLEGGSMPFIFLPDTPKDASAAYFTQIEVAAGVIVGVRIGFNPGELLDFIFGWFGIDIYNDDSESRNLKEKSNQAFKATGRKLADPQY